MTWSKLASFKQAGDNLNTRFTRRPPSKRENTPQQPAPAWKRLSTGNTKAPTLNLSLESRTQQTRKLRKLRTQSNSNLGRTSVPAQSVLSPPAHRQVRQRCGRTAKRACTCQVCFLPILVAVVDEITRTHASRCGNQQLYSSAC